MVLKNEDGDIFVRDHPRNKDVTLTVELRTQDTQIGLRFHGASLREGNSIGLDLGTKYVEGTVIRLE